MKPFPVLLLLLSVALLLWSGCAQKENAPQPAEGIVLSPIATYREAYPGNLVSVKLKVNAAGSVDRFGVRFQLPGAADFVALPEYPDITQSAGVFASAFVEFQYTLPADAAPGSEIKFKFIATAAGQVHEKVYTVKMLGPPSLVARLYNPEAAAYFSFSAFNVPEGKSVPASFSEQTKDIVATTQPGVNRLTGERMSVLAGWTSANGTKFILSDARTFNLTPDKYEAEYTRNSAREVSAVSMPAADQYYLARIQRNTEVNYAAIRVTGAPRRIFDSATGTTTEYMELVIKK